MGKSQTIRYWKKGERILMNNLNEYMKRQTQYLKKELNTKKEGKKIILPLRPYLIYTVLKFNKL